MNKEIELKKKGFSANYEGLDVLTSQTFLLLAAPGRYDVRALPKLRALENLRNVLI
ncbi:MAG: hypothetical protein ACYS30_18445 [Planctomycetota bacterium]